MNTESSQAQSNICYAPPRNHSIWHETSVLKAIIESFVDDSTTSQPHLLSVALTCKSFRDPALDVLWRSLDSWMPLLRLLTPFKLVNGFYVLQGPFGDKDWERFDTYAYRVKSFSTPHHLNVAQSTYFQLAQLRPRLFPALREATSSSTAEGNNSLLLVLSPTIKRLNLGGTRTAFHRLIGPALSMIAYGPEQENLNLTHLTLSGQPSTHPPGLLLQFFNLRHLDISGVIDAQNFSEMGELGHLESMVVQLPESLVLPDKELGFGQLRSLHVTSPFPSLLTVLEKMATTTLETITIIAVPIPEHAPKPILEPILKPSPELTLQKKEIPAPVPVRRGFGIKKVAEKKLEPVIVPEVAPPPAPVLPTVCKDLWRECFKILNSRWSETLQSITVDQDESIHTFSDRIPPDLFSGLSPFQRLECFKMQRCKFFPCDEGIHLLASACPNITMLHLPVECVAPYTPPPVPKTKRDTVYPKPLRSETSTTIVALWSLCDLCQNMEDLQISLDVTYIPQFLDTTIHSHHLTRLSISSHHSIQASRSHLLNIARHIDRLFPYLEQLAYHTNYGEGIWYEVRRILFVYQMVRMDDSVRRSGSE